MVISLVCCRGTRLSPLIRLPVAEDGFGKGPGIEENLEVNFQPPVPYVADLRIIVFQDRETLRVLGPDGSQHVTDRAFLVVNQDLVRDEEGHAYRLEALVG